MGQWLTEWQGFNRKDTRQRDRIDTRTNRKRKGTRERDRTFVNLERALERRTKKGDKRKQRRQAALRTIIATRTAQTEAQLAQSVHWIGPRPDPAKPTEFVGVPRQPHTPPTRKKCDLCGRVRKVRQGLFGDEQWLCDDCREHPEIQPLGSANKGGWDRFPRNNRGVKL